MWIFLLLVAWLGMIYYFGTSRWGRSRTQQFIDRLRANERLHAFLNRHHGKFRASFHYLEFGGLTLILYGAFTVLDGQGFLSWSAGRAIAAGLISAAAALLDELHQLTTPARCFRFVDYLHSCGGVCLALLLIRYGTL